MPPRPTSRTIWKSPRSPRTGSAKSLWPAGRASRRDDDPMSASARMAGNNCLRRSSCVGASPRGPLVIASCLRRNVIGCVRPELHFTSKSHDTLPALRSVRELEIGFTEEFPDSEIRRLVLGRRITVSIGVKEEPVHSLAARQDVHRQVVED